MALSIPKLGLGNESVYLFSLCLCVFVAKGFSDENYCKCYLSSFFTILYLNDSSIFCLSTSLNVSEILTPI